MAGTNVGAVYLDFKLNTKDVQGGLRGVDAMLNATKGRFLDTSGLLGRVFSRDAFAPVLGTFGDIVRSMNPMREGMTGLGSEFGLLTRAANLFGNNARAGFSGASREASTFLRSFERMSNGVSGGWDGLTSGLSDGWIGAWGGITSSFGGFINRIINGLNAMIGGINRISLDIPSWLGGGRLGFNVPTIANVPALAKGGIVSAPTLALVGERGKEAVLPLENNTGWMVEMANMLVDAMGAGAKPGGVQSVVLEVDGARLAEVLVDEIDTARERRGV